MRYLVVIVLVALLLVLLLRQLRPYLRLLQQFIDTIRGIQQMSRTGADNRQQQGQKLVCCETCGTWIPIGRALAAGASSQVFCSTNCLTERKRKK